MLLGVCLVFVSLALDVAFSRKALAKEGVFEGWVGSFDFTNFHMYSLILHKLPHRCFWLFFGRLELKILFDIFSGHERHAAVAVEFMLSHCWLFAALVSFSQGSFLSSADTSGDDLVYYMPSRRLKNLSKNMPEALAAGNSEATGHNRAANRKEN